MGAGVSGEPPRREDEETPDLLEQMICNEPPPTSDAIAERVADYIAALAAIEETRADDPLLAAERTIRADMCLIAGLSPAGSPGPADTHLALLEAVMQMSMGVRPSLMRHAPLPDPASHPAAPHIVLGRALAAAVMSLLMESGMKRKEAMRTVARQLQRAGVEFPRRNADPSGTIDYWRRQAKDPRGREPIHQAYRETHKQLAFRQTLVRPEARHELLLRALDKGVARGMFDRPHPDIEEL